MNKTVLTIICIAIAITSLADSVKTLPEKVPCAIADKQEFQIPDCLQLTGWLGSRTDANEKNRLVKIDTERLLEACRNSWRDIVDHRLYLTGAASYGEHFYDDYDFPNVGNVGETCVTVTWLQFNAQLLRVTGEARFAEQLERVVLNQLFGAQKPDGSGWGYYVQMEGKKPYSSTLDGHCCLSSGPRGVALIPTFATSVDAEGVVVNLYDAGTAKLKL
jgi:DUF1680 family protein